MSVAPGTRGLKNRPKPIPEVVYVLRPAIVWRLTGQARTSCAVAGDGLPELRHSVSGCCQKCCQSRKQAPVFGTCLTKQLALEATGGFEPPNGGFANLCLRPLGYVAVASGSTVAWPVGHRPDGIPGADYLFSYGAEGGTRTRTPLRAQRPQRCLSTNSNTSAQVLARSNVWQGRRDSNPRPSVLETDALAS